jgi:hypothetical protein
MVGTFGNVGQRSADVTASAHLPAFDDGDVGGEVVDREGDVAGKHGRDGLRGAPEWHVHRLDAGAARKQCGGKMRRGADAGCAIGDAVGPPWPRR